MSVQKKIEEIRKWPPDSLGMGCMTFAVVCLNPITADVNHGTMGQSSRIAICIFPRYMYMENYLEHRSPDSRT